VSFPKPSLYIYPIPAPHLRFSIGGAVSFSALSIIGKNRLFPAVFLPEIPKKNARRKNNLTFSAISRILNLYG